MLLKMGGALEMSSDPGWHLGFAKENLKGGLHILWFHYRVLISIIFAALSALVG